MFLADALKTCLALASQTDRLKEINADLRHRLRNEQLLKEVVVELRCRLTEAEKRPDTVGLLEHSWSSAEHCGPA